MRGINDLETKAPRASIPGGFGNHFDGRQRNAPFTGTKEASDRPPDLPVGQFVATPVQPRSQKYCA
jgi:hypothetical protein